MYSFLVHLCLVALLMCSNSVEASPVNGEVLFDPSSYRNEYDMPLSCEGKSFCFDKGDDYPESTFEELLDKMPVSLDARIAINSGEDSDCPVNDTYIDKPIYYILDENDQVRAVAQSHKKFQQIYSAKWCQREGEITENTRHFLKGSRTLRKYKIECVNEYMDADFLVLSEKDLKLQHARAKGGIPICCKCKYYERGADLNEKMQP